MLYTRSSPRRECPYFASLPVQKIVLYSVFYRCLHCLLPVCCAARHRQGCLCKQCRSSGTVFILERGKSLCPGSKIAPAVGGILNPSRSNAPASSVITRDLRSVAYALTDAWRSVLRQVTELNRSRRLLECGIPIQLVLCDVEQAC